MMKHCGRHAHETRARPLAVDACRGISDNVLRFPKPREPTARAAKGFSPPFTSLHFHRPRWQGRAAAAAGNACYLKYRALHLSTRIFGVRSEHNQLAAHNLVARHVSHQSASMCALLGTDEPRTVHNRRRRGDGRPSDRHQQKQGLIGASAGAISGRAAMEVVGVLARRRMISTPINQLCYLQCVNWSLPERRV
jgi:hypothetical protein